VLMARARPNRVFCAREPAANLLRGVAPSRRSGFIFRPAKGSA
jgi:hypothetical protein